MPAPYNGSCACGAVRLNISSEPQAVVSCSCTHCTKGAGGPSKLMGQFVESDVQVLDDSSAIAKFFHKDTGSGQPKEKAFCGKCGTQIYAQPESVKGSALFVMLPVLDGGLEIKPNYEIFVGGRPSWMPALKGIPQRQGMP